MVDGDKEYYDADDRNVATDMILERSCPICLPLEPLTFEVIRPLNVKAVRRRDVRVLRAAAGISVNKTV